MWIRIGIEHQLINTDCFSLLAIDELEVLGMAVSEHDSSTNYRCVIKGYSTHSNIWVELFRSDTKLMAETGFDGLASRVKVQELR